MPILAQLFAFHICIVLIRDFSDPLHPSLSRTRMEKTTDFLVMDQFACQIYNYAILIIYSSPPSPQNINHEKITEYYTETTDFLLLISDFL